MNKPSFINLATILLLSLVVLGLSTTAIAQQTLKANKPHGQKAKTQQPGWCYLDGKIINATKDACLEKKGRFFSGKKAAETYLDSQALGYCCLKEKTLASKKGSCLKQKGDFFKKRKKAALYCDLHKQGFCCLNWKVSDKVKGDCLNQNGKFFEDNQNALSACEPIGGCLVDGRVFMITRIACRKKKGDFFSKKDEAQKAANLKNVKTPSSSQVLRPSILKAKGKQLPDKLASPADSPNLIVTSVILSPRRLFYGQTMTLSYKVKNIGTLPVTNLFNVNIWVGNSLAHSQPVNPPLNQNSLTELLTYTFVFTACGKEIRIEADGNRRIDESDEEDNDWSKSIACHPRTHISPGVKLTFPRKGSILVRDNSYTISWTVPEDITDRCFVIDILRGGTFHFWLSGDDMCGTNYSWHIPSAFITGDDMSLRISSSDRRKIYDESGVFSIISYLPDLIIKTMDFDVDRMRGIITVKALIENRSLGRADSSKAKLTIRGRSYQKEISNINIPPLSYGAHYLMERSYNFPSSAEYTHTLEIDTNDDVDESWENNNLMTKHLIANRSENLPDLVVCISPLIKAKLHRNVTIPVTVRNMGVVRSPRSRLCIWIEKRGKNCYDIPELDPYSTPPYPTEYRCYERKEYWISAGWREYSAVIDPDNLIYETSESNNSIEGFIKKTQHPYRDFDTTIYKDFKCSGY